MSFLKSWSIREVRLAEVGPLTIQLLDQANARGFKADVFVYLETGARMMADAACRHSGIGAIPLRIQRPGGEAKGRLAGMLAKLPRWATNSLRRFEALLLWRGMRCDRTIGDAPEVNLSGRRVLILDDAVDTGTSVQIARQWSVGRGAMEVRVAALTVTTRMADAEVDFVLYRQMCRFPWSADSRERLAWESLMATLEVPQHAVLADGELEGARE